MRGSLNRSPLIGISPGYAGPDPTRAFAPAGRINFCDLNYIECIEEAGGLPLLLGFTGSREQMERYADRIDGLLLIGGTDIHAKRYGQEMLPTEQLPVEERDEFEFRFLELFLEREKPVFAICRGHQALNVALGGTLIQDIPSQMGSVHHLQAPGTVAIAHEVKVAPGSLASQILESEVVQVNSFHHQCVDRLADSLRATGWSEEGIVEIFEHVTHPYVLSVQWHPERMRMFPSQARLFEHFVRACAHERAELVS